ncbi:MAG TPA: ATP-binding cassette domain-containing protein [Tepidisphaeraceae bacterium]|nr:ATP-binding cassette domain-containing protein [Tepidisphaeraceae bacterium]
MEATRSSNAEQPPPPPAIALRGVGLLRQQRWILRGLDWTVPAGRCAAILGPNGSGKSTLARIVGCHLWPTEGSCSILGHDFGRTNLVELRKRIRLVQPAGPYDIDPALTARQVVLTGCFASLDLYDEPTAAQLEEADRLLNLVGLARVADEAYSRLSSGERMRSLLARAMISRPRLLLLDEPTSTLDLLAREQVLATVQLLAESADPPTIVMITHHIEELPPATTEILLLDDGRAAARGTPADVLREEILSRVYKCPVQVQSDGGRFYAQVHPDAWRTIFR